MMEKMSLLGLILAAGINLAYGADSSPLPGAIEKITRTKTNAMRILITVEGKAIRATLADNATARDFLALLPLNVNLEDYSRTEKIYYLPRKLSTEGAPSGIDPAIGDITYYAPWGNLAIFYKDFGYSTGLIKLGRVDSGVDFLSVSGSVKARIEQLPD